MKPNEKFADLPKSFWASVRSTSQEIGYSSKGTVKVPTIKDLHKAFDNLDLDSRNIFADGNSTDLANKLIEYYEYRADVLNTYVEPRLMDAARANKVFNELFEKLKPTCPIPMNKQKGDKKAPSFFTGIINTL